MPIKNHYFKLDKRTLSTVFGGDLTAWSWYYALKDYTARFQPDKRGYTRISNQVIIDDFGLDRFQFYRLNQKLVKLNLIAVDDIRRGKRIPSGIKILKML